MEKNPVFNSVQYSPHRSPADGSVVLLHPVILFEVFFSFYFFPLWMEVSQADDNISSSLDLRSLVKQINNHHHFISPVLIVHSFCNGA